MGAFERLSELSTLAKLSSNRLRGLSVGVPGERGDAESTPARAAQKSCRRGCGGSPPLPPRPGCQWGCIRPVEMLYCGSMAGAIVFPLLFDPPGCDALRSPVQASEQLLPCSDRLHSYRPDVTGFFIDTPLSKPESDYHTQ